MTKKRTGRLAEMVKRHRRSQEAVEHHARARRARAKEPPVVASKRVEKAVHGAMDKAWRRGFRDARTVIARSIDLAARNADQDMLAMTPSASPASDLLARVRVMLTNVLHGVARGVRRIQPPRKR